MRRRFVFDRLVAHLPNKRFSIIVGARQTGKSTVMDQLLKHCKGLGYATASLNAEHKDVRENLNEAPENLFQYLPDTKEKVYVFIDEIQKLDDPTNFLKVLWDDHKDKLKIIATGSSAFYMDEKFDDSLAGRKTIFNLYTCTFEEYLYLLEKDDLLEEFRRVKQNPEAKSTALPLIKAAFYRFMQYGGYPEVVVTQDDEAKVEILKDLRDSYVKKDLQDAGVKDSEAFYKLFRILAIQACGLVNTSELAKTVRIKEETVKHYMDIMQKSFHLRLVKPFFRNLEKELVKMPMAYFMDSGMRNVLTGNFLPISGNPDIGGIWENQVFRILADKYDIDELRFWRTTDKKEVDFVLPMLQQPLAFEVKANSNDEKPSKYKVFREAYPEFLFSFYTLEPFDEDLIRCM